MTLVFLISATTAVFVMFLAFWFRWIHYRTLLWILSACTFLTTLFFGLKPKGFRFINQVNWCEQGQGLVFTNIGMIYSDKPLGEAGIIRDTLVIHADIKPALDRPIAHFLTIVSPEGVELFSINQWRNNLFVSVRNTDNSYLGSVYLPKALSKDTAQRIITGIGGGTVWIGSSNNKKVNVKKIPGLDPQSLKQGTLLIGYSGTGIFPWRGVMYRLALSGNYCAPAGSTQKAAVPNMMVCDTTCTGTAALFEFQDKSGRSISNSCSSDWNLKIPFFPKIFKYEWPQPLTNIFPLSQFANRHKMIDPVINFFGFIPFGAVFYLLFLNVRKRILLSLFLTIALSAVTSTSIELLQIFIPTRVSQMIDIVLNIGGACAGALVMVVWKKATAGRQQATGE